MRFALVGNHPDGVEMACALVDSGRHQVVAYTVSVEEAVLKCWDGGAKKVGDLEEVLADPAVEAVIVAGHPANRPAQLRRALQSERHVLCVHPADESPEIAYEAAMLQNDTKHVLMPLLYEAMHPAVRRLGEFLHRGADPKEESPVGFFRLLVVERASTGEVLSHIEIEGQKPSFPGWEVLRTLGGEVVEVSAFAGPEEVLADEPVLVAGRFEKGGVFQATFLPNQPEPRWRLALVETKGTAELEFPVGPSGPAFLSWRGADGDRREESWEPFDPWPVLVGQFEDAVAGRAPVPNWQDEVRCLELDDAARRGVEKRRASTLDFQDANEEVGFKGTMALAGCGLLWVVMLLLIVSRFVPVLGWLMVPLLVIFLGLQLLRYLIPGQRGKDRGQ
jgi:predicted dehydrogenase